MKNIFSEVQFKKGKKTLFPMMHDRKFSMNMGELVPILCEEVIPGDTWRCKSEAIVRMAPMLAPIMHRLNIQTHFFFVPNRLVWDDWEDFITGGPTGTSNPVSPYIDFSGAYGEWMKNGSLLDYLGGATRDIAPTVSARISALPFRAYSLIYNEYYRDQDLETEIVISKDSGNASANTDVLELRNRAWEKDLFTSARPFTQKGAEVQVPLIGDAPILFDRTAGTGRWVHDNTGDQLATGAATMVDNLGDTMIQSGGERGEYDPNGTLEADLSSATSTTIADLRNAARLQEHLEKNMRGGSRYIEQMLVHFNVVSDDARLQRPEYLGGGKVPMMISEVLQTSETATTAQGNLSGHGVSAGSSPYWKKFFKEHGYIIGIMSVMPKTSYYQGFRRYLLKDDKYDYFFRDFEHIGEQGIYPAELYHDYDDTVNKGTFGYNMRYYEYKYIPSSVHGDFKNSLEYWHLGRKFASSPTLNKNFVLADPDDRIFAVQDGSDKLYCQVYNDVSAIRSMSRFSNPQL
jgi:hypothetical protein